MDENCKHQDIEDGCCLHEDNLTLECRDAACPLTKHTPGPWRNDGGRYGHNMSEITALNGQKVVCTVFTYAPDTSEEAGYLTTIPDPEGQANAALIAAVPETAAERDHLVHVLASRDRVIHEATPWMSEHASISARIEAVRALPALLEACKLVEPAIDSLLTEFISKAKATDWGLVNDCLCQVTAALKEAN